VSRPAIIWSSRGCPGRGRRRRAARRRQAAGIGSVPGEGTADTLAGITVDSRERFYNAIFFGYGVAWVWAARQPVISATAVRWLAGVMFLGGIGRILSMVEYGRPHWFQGPLTFIELALPPVFWWLAGAPRTVPS
jgi:hypothetical protein